MAKEVLKDPQIFISKKAREVFMHMKDTFKEFKHFENKDFFFLAFIFGFKNNKRKPLVSQEAEKSGFIRQTVFSPDENAILKTVAIIEEKDDVLVINNISKTYTIVEEYANGGIEYLKEFVFNNPASFVKKFSSFLQQCNR